MIRRFVLLLSFVALATPAIAQRLPKTVVPEHYQLAFTIDLANAKFSGQTGIDVRVTQSTSTITLHAVEMNVTSATVAAGGQTQTATVAMNAEAQTATLTLPKAVAAGKARIAIDYNAALNSSLRGLYLSKANNRSYAVTQFESTDARRAFPCFDEPAFKATYAVTVTADRGDIAISNGRMLSDKPGPGANQHTMAFSTTAKMSTYLVAIALGDFQCVEGSADNTPIRICATPDKKELTHLALESAEYILSFLNKYHTVKYPFGKLDVVAVPDFAAGAMENAAAIFYRETDLLADSQSASLNTRKTVFGVLAHEMAHMWFGDLVTMQWWDDIWLNEGFATWMATRPAAAYKSDWHIALDEASENQTALNLDSLQSTHPLHVTVDTPGEIEGVFDPISYEKGASVVRMVESYVGEDAFRKGINAHLEKHQYANATSEDFMSAVATASGKPVDRVMATFVLQPGVPQINLSAACRNGRTSVTLTQKRFFLDPSADSAKERWQIPVCLKAPGTASNCVLFTEEKQTFPVGATCAPWVFANAGGKGYYRTAYSPDAIKALARDVESALDAPERLSLVSDEWALVRAGRDTVANYLDLAAGFGKEPMALVLASVASRLQFIDSYLATEANRPKFRSFVRSLLMPAYESIGFDTAPGDSEDRRSLRNVLIGTLGGLAEEPAIIAKAKQAVTAALNGGASLDPILATTLVSVAASHGDSALFDTLVAAARKAGSPEEHYRYLYGLTNFEDPALSQRALEYTLSPELRSQDTSQYLSAFFGSSATRDRAWTFTKQRWTELEPKVAISFGDVNLVSSLANFCSADARDDIAGFFKGHPLPTAGRTLQQTIERINNCIDTRQRQQESLAQWLSAR